MLGPRTYGLLALAFTIVSLGDYLTKKWSQGLGTPALMGAWACYTAVSGIWFLVFKENPRLGQVGVVWTICAILATVMMGVFAFDERLSPTNKIGVFLCIIGVIMTSL